MPGSVWRGCGAGLGRCTYLSLILLVESDEGGGGHIPECLDLYAQHRNPGIQIQTGEGVTFRNAWMCMPELRCWAGQVYKPQSHPACRE